ncbi:MAG: 2Fe-2S iron-sulfur cluster-binding protein [Bacillota bacterium]
MEAKTVNIKVKRYDPSKDKEPYYQTYEVPIEKGATVLSALRYIYENLDHSLVFYYSCRIGKCVGCHVSVDGKTRLACNTIVDKDVTLEPQAGYKVVRDLVVDKSEKVGA